MQFAVHLPARRMLVLYAALFVVGSILAASAHSLGLFVAGHVLQGLTTSLMLIAAVPPLIVGWPTSRMRWTAMAMNLCIFGAVAAGLAGCGCAAAFFGASELTTHRLLGVITLVPLAVGAALIFALVAYEYLIRHPLMPVRRC